MGTVLSKLLSTGKAELCYPAAKNMLPELWHIVMDHLVAEGDYSSIEACSLVSRPWRPIAQQRMLNKVTLPNLTVAAEFLDLVSANPRIGSYVRELHLSGDGARVPFKTFYAILAAVPRLHYLALCDLSFLHWPLNKILLNPIECLNLSFIGVGDGSCSARRLLECFRGLFHDVQELEMLPCDAEFLDCYYGTLPYLRLRKLTLPDTDAQLLAFLSRVIASCASMDLTISNISETCEFMEAVGSAVDKMQLRCSSYGSVRRFPSLISDGCTSLRTVRLDVVGPVRYTWRMRAKILKQLPNTVRELSLGLIPGSPDVSHQNLALAHTLFTRFKDLERLTFTSPSDSTCVEGRLGDDVESAGNMSQQLRLVFPDLYARGVLQEFLIDSE